MPDVVELEVRGRDGRRADAVTTGATDLVELDWLGDPGGFEDAIELGPPDRPWAWQPPDLRGWLPRIPTVALICAVIVGLAIAVGVSLDHPDKWLAQPAPGVSAAPTYDDARTSLSSMIAAVTSPIRLADYSIGDNSRAGCRPDARGEPVADVVLVMSRYQPQFRLRDSSKGYEQSGVCSVQVRFVSGPAGPSGSLTQLIVTVLPPPNSFTPFVASQDTGASAALQVVANIDGWRVEVGVVGVPGALPDEHELTAVATDARLRW